MWIFKNKKLKSLGFLLDTVRDTRDTDVNRGYSLVKITHNSLLKISQIEREYYTTFFTTEMDMTSDADPIKIDQYCKFVDSWRIRNLWGKAGVRPKVPSSWVLPQLERITIIASIFVPREHRDSQKGYCSCV